MKNDKAKDGLFYVLGSLGIVFVLNLMAIFIFHKESALFFNHQWWSSWFPAYTIWLIFLIIKIGIKVKER
ncbi:MAG: hypothetical protein KAG86_04215 [Gammaproteobacteria bacterium]|nr:hypothetical protein [Gammaproteobacteria bacterium]